MLYFVSIIQAIILGVIQGLSEFLPISSSGHLVVVPELFGIPAPSLAFDVLLHLATVAAAVAFFYRDIGRIILSFVAPRKLPHDEVKRYRRLTLWLVAGSIPVAVVGLTLNDFVESLFHSTLAVGIFLMLTSLIMVGAEVTYVCHRPQAGVGADGTHRHGGSGAVPGAGRRPRPQPLGRDHQRGYLPGVRAGDGGQVRVPSGHPRQSGSRAGQGQGTDRGIRGA